MEHIWSPWRLSYMTRKDKPTTCIFCEAIKQKDSEDNLIVRRGERAFAILNRYPYTSGHLMIVPNQHLPSLLDLDAATLSDMMALMQQALHTIASLYQPEGFNVGANIGSCSGAGVAVHFHWHVVPRWGGDTNFMTTVGGARVLPEDLQQTYQRIRDGWLNI